MAPPGCPVAASRAKLTMLNTVSKIRGQVKNPGYPQSEGLLGECMIRHGKELGGESNFGESHMLPLQGSPEHSPQAQSSQEAGAILGARDV